MPESKSRKKTKKVSNTAQESTKAQQGSPSWLVPTMLALMVGGLIWVVVAYLLRMDGPIPGIGNWNLVVGFALLISGFMLTTKWK